MRDKQKFTAKLVLAFTLVAGLLTFAAMKIAPGVGVVRVALVAMLIVVLALALMAVLALLKVALNQYVLHRGGTDPQWLWFRNDPPGLKRLPKDKD